MKIKNLLFTFCLFTTTFAIAQTESLKKYQIKSFVVEYKTTASGSFNGMGSVNSEGTKTLYVDNYGALEVSEKMEKSSTIMMGTTQVENRHELDLTDASYIYHIDLVNKSGTKMEVASAQQMANAMYEGLKKKYNTSDPKVIGRKMIEENGGKWLGNESFLGKDCEVFELMGVKIWSYKNITLKSEGSIGGITTTEVATSIKENVVIPSSKFNVPSGITFEELSDVMSSAYQMGDEEGESENSSSNITLTADKFKAGVSKISQSGFQSMGVITAGGTFGATYVNSNGSVFMVQAVDMISSSEFESRGVEVVKSLTINGHSAKVIKSTEDEDGDSEESTSVVVSYPEYNMSLVVVSPSNVSSDILESVASQVKF